MSLKIKTDEREYYVYITQKKEKLKKAAQLLMKRNIEYYFSHPKAFLYIWTGDS